MLTIRDSQIQAFTRVRMPELGRRLREWLQTTHPSRIEGLTESALGDQIMTCLEKAGAFGMRGDRDMFRWMELCLRHGFDFTDRPENGWMVSILRDKRINSPADRLTYLMDLCRLREETAESNRRLREAYLQR